jgi:hypothetical protein
MGGIIRPIVNVSDFAIVLLLLKIWSGLAVAVAALLLYSILVSETADVLASLFTTFAFLCACEILYALHAGTSYPSGLACLLGGIWCANRKKQEGGIRSAAFAGIFGALAVAFWLPYVVALPALLYWAILGRQTKRFQTAATLVLACAVVGALLFGLGADFAGVHSAANWKAWIADSGHGTKQTHNLVRSLFGLPRSFLDFGLFGVRMKQYLLKDPYARVGLGELLTEAIWKVALFYLALAALMSLHFNKKGRQALVVFGLAFLANMGLAVAFEGGSQERYLPLYPFFFITAGYLLSFRSTHLVSRVIVISLFVVTILGNLPSSFAVGIRGEQRELASRLEKLPSLPPNSVLFLVGDDPLFHLREITPFDEIDRLPSLQITPIYVPMMNSASWKRDFSLRVLRAWQTGGVALITTRVWAAEPERSWNWTEGDDPNISWKHIVSFFGRLDHSLIQGGEGRFALLTRSSENEMYLSSLANSDFSQSGPSTASQASMLRVKSFCLDCVNR